MSFQKLGKSNIDRSSLIVAVAILMFAVTIYFHINSRRPEIIVSKQDSAVNINTLFLKLFATGNKRLISDILWIQTLIESDVEHYKGNPANNWMFLRFNSISELDVPFYENYLYGGQYLSIVKDDPESAAEIMNKGLKLFPNDYRLNFNQGFNYYFELDDLEKGLPLFEKIKNHPEAPAYLTSLIIKLKHELKKDPTVTITLLKEAYDKAQDRALKNKLATDIYAVRATIDLQCLNTKQINCERFDAHGEPYIFNGKEFVAPQTFKPYKIHKK